MEPSIQSLEIIIKQHANNTDGVNSSTQLSIGDSCDSSTTTSSPLMFAHSTNATSNGNLLFPLTETDKYNEIKDMNKISWDALLAYLRAQRIVKNIERFKNFKRTKKYNLNTEKHQIKQLEFPHKNFINHKVKHLKCKESKLKNFKFPLKPATAQRVFPCSAAKGKNKKKYQMTCSKLQQHSKLKCTLKKLPLGSNLKCIKENFPLQQQISGNRLKFPLKLTENENKSLPNYTSFSFENFKLEIKKVSETFPHAKIYKDQYEQIPITQFPYKLATCCCHISTFPITQFNNSLHYNYNHGVSERNSKNKSTISLSMAQNISTEREQVFQVQDDAPQTCVVENTQSLTATDKNQPPPQSEIAKTMYGQADGVNAHMLAAINSINNTHPNEAVRYYAEKIESFQNAIVSLFEKIQNSLTTNHNRRHESTNATKHDYDDDNIRFALTPPMSVTSVRNTKRNGDEEAVHRKYDLGDLCDRQVSQIVECSEVLDTLAETVDYGVTTEQTKSTGSILVKSEEPISPNPLNPNPFDESVCTSLEEHTNASDLLPKYNVNTVYAGNCIGIEKHLEFEPIREIDIAYKPNDNVPNQVVREVSKTVIKKCSDNEQENISENNNLSSREKALEHENNILGNDIQIDEMKFEMNRVKGALPNSVSERSLGKRDNLITASESNHYGRHSGTNATRSSTDTTLSNNRVPQASSSTRNHCSSLYTRRPSLKTENSSTLATTVPKHSTINTHLAQDGITSRTITNTTAFLNETTAPSRAALNSLKTSSDANGNTLSNRRPSLGTLRSTQSTSLLSADLPHYSPLTTLPTTNQTISVNRAMSMDSSLGDILPERTRLRRQRRLRNPDSQDEPENAIERLNLLRARISASLSEVKGVLKQYSTDAENENENQTSTAANSCGEIQKDEKKEGPVVFRFVKKVRRRSLFLDEPDENDHQKENETNANLPKENTENIAPEEIVENKDETDNCKLIHGSTLPSHSSVIIKADLENKNEEEFNKIEVIANKEAEVIKVLTSQETSDIKLNKNLYTLTEEIPESLEESWAQTKVEETEMKKEREEQNNKTLPKDEAEIKMKEEEEVSRTTDAHDEANKLENDGANKTKKKLILKSKDPSRRASLAAVEGSKIEPPVKLATPAKIRRRPSDSEAMVKRKLITAKINTSGVVEEVTPKLKIVKVKKPSTKSTNNNNLQLATTQTKSNEKDNDEHHIQPLDKDNKSIYTDENNYVLMPKPSEQQLNSKITRQRNLLLPTQLVIDDAASLNEKTNENSVLSPRQQEQQQKQEQHQLEKDQQATKTSTATNFKSSDLKANSAMLENVTTALSSSTNSEAHGQLKRKNSVQQTPENLDDLLQQETIIVKPAATTNKQIELKFLNQIENQSTIKDILPPPQPAPTETFDGNSESVETKAKESEQQQQQQQKQKSPTQHQQVITTTDVAHVKSEAKSNNRNDDIKTKASLKKPCIDKATTSTLVVDNIHKQLQQQQEQAGEQSITNTDDTKTISSPHISISSTSDATHKTTAASLLTTETANKQQADQVSANLQNAMPELQLTPAPVQTAHIVSHPDHHQKKKIIIKKTLRQTSVEKTKKTETESEIPLQDVEQQTETTAPALEVEETKQIIVDTPTELAASNEELTEECSESTEISESSVSFDTQDQEAAAATLETLKKERKVKKKVIIKRQKRRLSIGDNFFKSGNEPDAQNPEIETLEKPIAYVSDDETDKAEQEDETAKNSEENKTLKSCILHKEYNIGDEVLYAERFKKTQIKWRRGRIKERITSISYLLDIDGKDVSSHINYLKKFTGRKVSFGGKEYLEIDYEQLAEEEEKAEKLQRRTYSIWNMV